MSPPAAPADAQQSLPEFLASVAPLELAERYRLVSQARALLDGLYVHLALKRAMYGLDPVQRLRLLERRLQQLSDVQFHGELSQLFRELRDLHTVYQLPDPYRGHVAALGLLVERYLTPDGAAHHLVTKLAAELADGPFQAGVELTSWNGIPIDRAVELNAAREAGANPAARLARGLQALTVRPLLSSPPPDEHWVIIGYRDSTGADHERRLAWRVLAAHTRDGRAQDPTATIASALGVDATGEAARQIKRHLFAPPRARRAEAHALASVLSAATRRIHGRPTAYLRLYSFNVSSARRYLEQLTDILARLPQDGLIIDLRGNPGGLIPAAEGALQLLTDRPIDPVRFSLAATPLALTLCRANPAFAPWRDSLDVAAETGETYSQAIALSAPGELADGLPRYPGPSVLITDALCYSAADIFAAGYQDNHLGRILGTDARTGAGGANVWTHDLLRLWLPDALDALPAGTGLRLALRRATRAGANAGMPIEDLGIRADRIHELTRRDITGRNQDLLAAAAGLMHDAS